MRIKLRPPAEAEVGLIAFVHLRWFFVS